MPLKADPGGVFASDAHRRVLAHLPAWRTEEGHKKAAELKLAAGTINSADEHERSAHFADLSADATRDPHTEADSPDDVSAVLAELQRDGHVETGDEDGHFRMTQKGFDALTGPIADEPPPLEGRRLEIARELDALNAQEDAAKVAAVREDRLAWHRAEIERLEAEAKEQS